MTIDILTGKTVSDINAEIFKAIHMPIKRVRPSLIRVTCDADEETRAAALKAIAYVFGKSVSVSIDRAAPVTVAALTAPAKMPRRSRKRHKEAASRAVKPKMVNGAIYGAGFIIPTSAPAPVPTPEVHKHVKACVGCGNPIKERIERDRKLERAKKDPYFGAFIEEHGVEEVISMIKEYTCACWGIIDVTPENLRAEAKYYEDEDLKALAALAELIM